MELRQLRLFLGTAEELHFGRAAERLFIAQSALSQHIRRLERELGVELFDRSGRQVRLTPAGQLFREEARDVLDRASAAIRVARAAANGESGTLSIGYFPAVGGDVLADILRRLCAARPGLQPELHGLDLAGLDRALDDGRLALFVGPGAEELAGSGEAMVGEEEIVALVPDGHPLATRSGIDPTDLGREPFVLPRPDAAPRLHHHLVSTCIQAGFRPSVVHETDCDTSWALAVAAGLGVSLAPATLARRAMPGAQFRPLTGSPARLPLVVRWRPEAQTPQVDAFLDAAGRPPSRPPRSPAARLVAA